MRTGAIIAIAGILLILMAGYFALVNNSGGQGAGRILVYMPPTAARLIEDFAQEYSREKGVVVERVIHATGQLLIKLESAQEGDILVTADDDFMLKAIEKGLVYPESVRVISFGIPALAVPKGNPANITGLEDLVRKDVKIGIADPVSAPYGKVAIEILVRAGIYEVVKDKINIYPDVNAVANQVRLGQVDVAILPHYVKAWFPNEVDIVWLRAEEVVRAPCQLIGITKYTRDYNLSRDFIDSFAKFLEREEVAGKYLVVRTAADLMRITPYKPDELKLTCLIGELR